MWLSDRPSEIYGPITVPAYSGFLQCCPYALLMRDDVAEVWTAYRWYSKSQLGIAYGGEMSVPLRNAISAFDMGISHGEKERLDKAKDDARK